MATFYKSAFLLDGENAWIALLLVSLATWALVLHQLRNRRNKGKPPLPPGPRSLPLLGCLPFLPNVHPPELLFSRLAETYGEIMLIRLGAREIVVVSSADMAAQFLKLHDQEFANRPAHIAYQHMSWDDTALVFISASNPLFTPTRRLFASEIVAPRKVAAGQGVRKLQVVKMVRAMVQEMESDGSVNVTKAVSTMSLNLSLCMAFGLEFGDRVVGEIASMLRSFQKLMHLLIRSSYGNYADFFPALRWLDLQGIEGQFLEIKAELRSKITALIEKKRQEMRACSEDIRSGASERDVVSKLLSMQGEDRVTEEQMVSVVITILLAGTDSIYKTITEAIHEVVSHAPIHQRAVDSLDAITSTTRLVEESDLPNLPLLHQIIKETLRLLPPTPTFPPHRSFTTESVGGYSIPKDASVVLNMLPIMHDSRFWEKPEVFDPDRFNKEREGAKVTPQGSDFHFIPFGFGRRQCPAVHLAMNTVTYTVAVCLQCVAWRIPSGGGRRATVSTAKEPRKKADVVLQGSLRVDPRLLEIERDA